MRNREIKIWYGKLEDAERFPDLKYWQSQPTEKIFDTAWEIVLEAHALKEKICVNQDFKDLL